MITQNKRPNILFLMSDQHRFDMAGFAGNPVVRTPTLDHLAESGVVFNNAYTPSPICVPARQCMASGQLPKTCNCEGWIDLEPNYMTFARQLARYGYNTTCSGKLHHEGIDQMQGWTSRLAADSNMSARHIPDIIESEYNKYKPDPETGKWSNEREVRQARGGDGPYQKIDRIATQAAIDYLDRYFDDPMYNRPQNHRPLMFKLSLLQPHYPFFGDEELFNYYLDKVRIYEEAPCGHPVLSLSQQCQPVNAAAEEIRRATASYYAMTETVDRYYGQILQKLTDLGEDLDNWIIIYTSDHGEMLGQHGIWEKTRFYEASVRVPMIIRWPKNFDGGRVVNENVNLCDLFATICDLAGVETPEGLDSRSLAPLMRGDSSNWLNESVSQFNKHVMIKRDDLKYQYYDEDGPEVLFDLAKDPTESENFAEDSAYTEDMDKFRKRLSELGHGPEAISDYINAGY